MDFGGCIVEGFLYLLGELLISPFMSNVVCN